MANRRPSTLFTIDFRNANTPTVAEKVRNQKKEDGLAGLDQVEYYALA